MLSACSSAEKDIKDSIPTFSSAGAEPSVSDGNKIELLVAGSDFCGVHGLAVNAQGQLFAGSVVGQRIYQVNTLSRAVQAMFCPQKEWLTI